MALLGNLTGSSQFFNPGNFYNGVATQSLRFNDETAHKLTRTFSSDVDNDKKMTISVWAKRGNLSGSTQVILANYDGVRFLGELAWYSDNTLTFDPGGNGNGASNSYTVRTTALFRDVSAWYHIVVAVDTTQSTDSNRVKIYTNGSLETSLAGTTYPTENYDTSFGVNGQEYQVSANTWNDDQAFDGYMTETHFIDGSAKAQTDFGEFDDNGVWIPKKYTGTYGTNGYFLQFKQTGTSQNSSGIGADTSGNDNHYAVTNFAATDITEDTCTNNFATINPLANQFNPAALSEGNTRVDFDNGTSTVYNISTIGVSSGKWYCEIKAVTIPDFAEIGIASRPCIASGNDDKLTKNEFNYGYSANNGNVKSNNSGGSSYGNTYDDGDIIGIALDLDNNKLYFSKNGTFQNSGDPTSGSTGTGAVSIEAPSGTIDGVYYFAVGDNRNAHDTRMDCNFGNPAYSISSSNNDGKYGNFEYAVPSGYYALCTKRLAEFG